jgi:hypothetical protein
MRLAILATAAALLAGPALAQTGTSPQGGTATPQANQQTLSDLDKACRERGAQSTACQDAARLRAGTTGSGGAAAGSTTPTPPAAGAGAPARPATPSR